MRMPDPCLNSVHLESPRRQQFRAARQALLNACGGQTIAAQFPSPPVQQLADQPMIAGLPDREAAAVRFWLIDRDRIIPLKVGINTIGRSPDCDVVVEDAFVSRRHCAILVHAGDGCEVHDVASKNGTFLNGAKLARPTRLRAGDEIRMCDHQFVFVTKLHDGEDEHPGHGATQLDPFD
jgi:hypothetical protein